MIEDVLNSCINLEEEILMWTIQENQFGEALKQGAVSKTDLSGSI